ncbi:unnamed protein product [Linum trigynum]|uniref:Uncharacterized protein n=1 Tax=Linum trigynum TaxID=586398 RepID=A0AAV2F722_9ROSI
MYTIGHPPLSSFSHFTLHHRQSAMETLVRSTTATFSHRRSNGYEQLNPYYYGPTAAPRHHDDDIFYFPCTSKKRKSSRRRIATPLDYIMAVAWSPGYRIMRARQRQIFLMSYQLASEANFSGARREQGG